MRSPLRKLRLFDEKPTAKRALSVLRTAATGRTLLARGELVTDVGEMREYMPDGIDELLAIKRTAEQQQLERSSAPRGAAGSSRRFDAVDAAWPSSVLPAEPPITAVEAADAWLREVRRNAW